MEIWKKIPSTEGKYEASCLGNIRNTKTKRVLKPVKNRYGYLIYSILGKKKKGHRLVAEAFIPNPNNLPQVNHKNEIKTDNRLENLEYCDNKYNCNYGERTSKISKKHCIPIIQLDKNNKILCEFNSIREASIITKTQETHIKDVCKKYRKTAGGYIWRYKNVKSI